MSAKHSKFRKEVKKMENIFKGDSLQKTCAAIILGEMEMYNNLHWDNECKTPMEWVIDRLVHYSMEYGGYFFFEDEITCFLAEYPTECREFAKKHVKDFSFSDSTRKEKADFINTFLAIECIEMVDNKHFRKWISNDCPPLSQEEHDFLEIIFLAHEREGYK